MNSIQKLAAIGALALLPTASFGATFFDVDGDGKLIDEGTSIIDETGFSGFLGFIVNLTDVDQMFQHTFDMKLAGTGASTVTISLNALSLVQGLTMSWIDALTNTVLSSTPVTGSDVSLTTKFEDPDTLIQTMKVSWTGVKPNPVTGKPPAAFDGDVALTTVPLPAGLLLMGTALAGLGIVRRRKLTV